MQLKIRLISIFIAFVLCFNILSVMAAGKELEWSLDYGLKGQEMPFFPPDKYVTMQNPPDFSWPHEQMAISYDLRICRDIKMTDIAYAKNGITLNLYNFDKVFETGTYYWSVRFNGQNGASDWSAPRRFRIDDNAVPFPVSDIETLLGKIPKSHPRIWTTKETLDEFRGFSKTGSTKRYYEEKVLQFVREQMKQPFAPEPVYVPTGNYVDDSKALQNLRTVANRLIDVVWKSAFAYLITNDTEIGQYAVKAVLELARWSPYGATSYVTQDQIHRDIAYKSAMAYDWLFDIMKDDEKASVLSMIKTRTNIMAEHLLGEKGINVSPYDSHGWTALGYIGIVSIATYGELDISKELLSKLLPVYINQLPPWSREDGGWSQGQSYWKYSSHSNREFTNVLSSAGIIDLNQKAWRKNEVLFPIYTRPVGSIEGFGDQSPRTALDRYDLWAFYGIYYDHKNPYTAWSINQFKDKTFPDNLDAYFLLPNSTENAKPPVELPKSRLFKDIGWAAMHSDLVDENRISLYFKSSPFGTYNHSHSDQNSFFIQAYGEPLAIDSGYYDSYHSSHDINYTRKTYAHNAVTIDGGKGQAFDDFTAKGTIRGFVNTTNFDAVSGDATKAYKNEVGRAVRHVIYLRPDMFIVIDDLEAKSNTSSAFEWWLNAQEDISLYESGTGARIVKGRAALDAKIHYPAKVTGYYSNLFSGPDLVDYPAQGDYKASPVHKRVWFETPKLPKTKIVTTLDVHLSDKSPRYVKSVSGDNYIKLLFPDGSKAYVKTTDAEIVEADNITFSGAAVVVKDSEFLLVDGTSLSIDGKAMVNARDNITIAVGNNEISFSATDDTKLEVDAGEVTKIAYADGTVLVEDKFCNGITYSKKNNMLAINAEKDFYNLRLNDKPQYGLETEHEILTFDLDGNVKEIPLNSYTDEIYGKISYGTLGNEGGYYEVQEISPNVNAAFLKKGERVFLEPDIKVKAIGTGLRLKLHNLLREKDEVVLVEGDEKNIKMICAAWTEAEGFIEKSPALNVYTTRTFLSGGAGVSLLNTPKDSAKWSFNIQKSAKYDLIIKFVAWDKEVTTTRIFDFGKDYYQFDCPLTESWGTVPEEWRIMRVKSGVWLDEGINILTIKGMTGLWNIDWLGLVRADD